MTRTNNTTRKALTASAIMTSALALALSAGTALSYAGPDGHKNSNARSKQTSTANVNMDARLLHFARSDDLMGSSLRNTSAEEIGTVSDFIVDRGSGHIEFAVVKSGGILGFGGKSFALPYNELRYQPTTNGFSTNMTEEQLERQTEFIPENWEELADRGWVSSAGDWMSGGDEIDHAEDSIRDAVRRGERVDMEGTVTRIIRKSYKGEEQVFVIVQDDSNTQHTMILGPSWYVMGAESPIQRGDEVQFRVVEYDTYYIIADGEVNGERMTMRDKQGRAAWDTQNERSSSRYILLSDLVGVNAEVAGTTVGEIQTTVVEGGSGQVAMLALDPNDNFFGLGDELSLIPWGATSVRYNAPVLIDSNEAELERTIKMPSDVSTLRTPSSVSHAYENFGIDMPEFEARDNRAKNQYGKHEHSSKHYGNAWAKDSDLMTAVCDGKDMKVRGTFAGFSDDRVVDGAPEARFITVKTSEGTHRMIVAPVWFADRQGMNLEKGDELEIHAKRATFDGQEWIAIVRIERDDDEWTLWDDETPAWSN